MDIKHFILNLYPEYLNELIHKSSTYREVLNKLNVPANPTTLKYLKQRIGQLKLDSSKLFNDLPGLIWQLQNEEFIKIIEESNSFSEALRKIGLKVTGGNVNTLKDRIINDGLDIDHIVLNNLKSRNRTRLPLEEVLVKNSPVTSTKSLKERLLKEGILKNECVKCGTGPEWQGKPLTLELDHIDGDNRNNEKENLRILCPNCHSQTVTFGGKNIKKPKIERKHYCSDCHSEVYKGSTICVSCSNLKRQKAERPSKEKLSELILQKPFIQIGKDYGVSDNAVRKWCKHYGLPATKRDIELYKISETKVS